MNSVDTGSSHRLISSEAPLSFLPEAQWFLVLPNLLRKGSFFSPFLRREMVPILERGKAPTEATGNLQASEDLRRDYIFITTTQGSIGVSIGGTLGLSAKKIYTLHLIGNNGSFDQTSTFQPIDGSNITFASTAADSTGFLAVEFETGAGYVDGVDTLDFTWSIASPETGVFQGFAIVFVGPVVPRGTLISIR